MHYRIDALGQRGPETWRVGMHPVFDDGSKGERIFCTVKARTRREAQRLAEEARAEAEEAQRSGECDAPSGGAPTLLEWQERWAERLAATGAVTEKTAAGYVDNIKGLGEVAHMRLDEIGDDDLVKALAGMLGTGISPNTANTRFKTAKKALDRAREAGIIRENPAEEVKPPKKVPTKPRSLSNTERERMLALVPKMVGPLPVAICLGLMAGLRGEEALGLQWRDFNEGDGLLTIRRVVTADRNGMAKVEERTKSASSLRTLPVAKELAAKLVERRTQHRSLCVQIGIPFSDSLFILGDVDGRPLGPNEFRRSFKAFSDELGFGCTYHWLRHTFATGMIARGVDVRTVSYWLGHSDPGFTLSTYCNTDPVALAESVAAVDAMAGGSECGLRPATPRDDAGSALRDICEIYGVSPEELVREILVALDEIGSPSLNTYAEPTASP